VEVKRGIRRGGEPGDQRGDDKAHDLVDAPERCARAERGLRSGTGEWQAVCVGGNERQRRRKFRWPL
jgi:hypothetical protein